MIDHYLAPAFWTSVFKIIGIDILLSGDNAVVIALACRGLPPRQQRLGIIFGAGAAVLLRILFAIFIVYLLEIPWLKVVGGLLLFWIAVKLVTPEQESDAGHVHSASNLWQAVRTVVVADAVMSLDNVVAIAAAAEGSVELLIFGLAVSIPLIVYGSTLILKLLHRFPIVITAGGALLGYVAGEVLVSDPAVSAAIEASWPSLHGLAPALGAGVIVLAAAFRSRKRDARPSAA